VLNVDNDIDRINQLYMNSNNNINDRKTILSRLRHSCIFKIDRKVDFRKPYGEFDIYKKLITNEKTISPYFLLPFGRARIQMDNNIINKSSALRSILSDKINNNNHNNNNNNNNNEDETGMTGLLMERCVGTLSNIIKSDRYFDSEFNLINNEYIDKFNWQPSKSSTSVLHQSIGKFSDLSISTSKCLLKDLRNQSKILLHFLHLCECVKYLHSKYIIHTDLKLSNIFIRVIERNEIKVEKIQLILADFDISALCKSTIANNIDTKDIKNPPATYGYHECIYNRLTSFNQMKKNDCKNYFKTFNEVYAGIDIFELGIIFLIMIYRIKFENPILYWIKYEMEKHNIKLNKNNQYCTPACVLLKHKLKINDVHFAAKLKNTYSQINKTSIDFELKIIEEDFTRSKYFEYERERHVQVINDVENKLIKPELCILLDRMTCEPQHRLTISECIKELTNIIK